MTAPDSNIECAQVGLLNDEKSRHSTAEGTWHRQTYVHAHKGNIPANAASKAKAENDASQKGDPTNPGKSLNSRYDADIKPASNLDSNGFVMCKGVLS